MNEIKAQEYIKVLNEEIEAFSRYGDAYVLYRLKALLNKFKSMMTKDYEHGEHGV